MNGTDSVSGERVDEALIDALVRLWEAGERPAVDAFLAERGPVAAATLVEVLRVDQDARWRSQERVAAEAYLERFAQLEDDPQRALDLIHSEVLLREQLGEAVSAAEYCHRFPAWIEQIQRQFTVHASVDPVPSASNACTLLVGAPAPDFSLPSTKNLEQLGEPTTLAEHRGQWLVLFFYPRDFSMVCPTEVMAFSRRLDEFREMNAAVLGVSTDPVDRHAAWITEPVEQGGLGGLRFPLASDVDGDVSARYGVLLREQNVALRGLFIIDPGSILQYMVVHNLAVGRRCDVVLRVLRALQTGGACGEGWEPGEANLDPKEAIHPQTPMSRYEMQGLLGEGSSSLVYRALDPKLRRKVALKVLRQGDPDRIRRLLAEARSTASLQHPNICVVYEVDDREGFPFIAMQYVEGQTLQEQLKGGALPLREVVAIGSQIADGLGAAHAARVVHGDMKPHNVMISTDGHVTLLDFGLAKHFSADPSGTTITDGFPGVVAGTPAYMSPEQIQGAPLDPRSDVFSLGIVVYQMATGALPFPGRTAYEVTAAILREPVSMPASVPAALARVLGRMLEKAPEDRYPSMAAVRTALAVAAGGED